MALPESGITNWDMWTALGGVGAFFLALFGTISGIRLSQHKKLQGQLTGIETRLKIQIEDVAEKAEKDHEELRVQVTGLSNTIRDHYLMRREHEQAFRAFNDSVTDIRKDIGSLGNRIDDVLRDMYRRPG